MKQFKKLLAFCLCVGVLTSLSGCSSDEAPKEDETKTEEKAQEGKVQSINLESSDGILKYTNHEVTTDYEGNPAIIIYYDYTNKKEEPSFAQLSFYPQVFQNGVECEMAITTGQNEALSNSTKEITKGTTLNVAFIYSLQDTENPVTVKVTDHSAENLMNDVYQEQEINLV